MSAPHSPSRDPFFLALSAACLVHLALLAPGLVPADLNLTYPFMDGDSWDWISNGLLLAGEDVRYTGRSPLLPLAIAALHRLGALSWLPAVLQGLFVATVLGFYSMAARLVPRRAAFAVALTLLLNFSLAGLSLQVMADVPTACLLLLAARSFDRAGEDRRRYLASGLFAGLAALAQSVGVLWVPAAGLTALVHRRRDLRSPWLWTSLAIPLALPAFWALVQPPAVVGSGGFARAQWLLLSPQLGAARGRTAAPDSTSARRGSNAVRSWRGSATPFPTWPGPRGTGTADSCRPIPHCSRATTPPSISTPTREKEEGATRRFRDWETLCSSGSSSCPPPSTSPF